MKHTPGPWEVRELEADGRIVKVGGHFEIWTPEYDVVVFDHRGGGPIRKIEDAHLIAAAPEMLEALKEIMECPYAIDQATVPKAGIDTAPEQVVGMMSMALLKYRKARQAIAKAEGKYENTEEDKDK